MTYGLAAFALIGTLLGGFFKDLIPEMPQGGLTYFTWASFASFALAAWFSNIVLLRTLRNIKMMMNVENQEDMAFLEVKIDGPAKWAHLFFTFGFMTFAIFLSGILLAR